MAFWNKWFCKHDWRIENKDVLDSAWEQLPEAERQTLAPAPWMFAQTVATTYICNKCGEVKTVVVALEAEPADEPK